MNNVLESCTVMITAGVPKFVRKTFLMAGLVYIPVKYAVS
jgi:hypothetical protein